MTNEDVGDCVNCGDECDTLDRDGAFRCDSCGAGPKNESLHDFDRFVDSILLKEGRRPQMLVSENPRRKLAARHQERPLGRIVIGRRP